MAIQEGDVWQWETEFLEKGSGERGIVTGHHRLSDFASASDMKTVGNTFVSQINALWEAMIASADFVPFDVVISCSTAQRISPAGGRVFVSYGTGQEGNGTIGSSVPAQCSVVITKYSDATHRSGRGRVFLPFISDEAQKSGVLESSKLTDIENGLAAMYVNELATLVNDKFTPVVYSRKLGQPFDIVDLDVNPVLGTQRRRVNMHQRTAPNSV